MTSFDFTGLVINSGEDSKLERQDKELGFVLVEGGDSKAQGDTNTPQRLLFRIISSRALLKYVASASGLWTGSNWWNLVLAIVTVPMIILALIGEAVVVFYCGKNMAPQINATFCRKTRGDLRDLSVDEHDIYQFLRFLAVAAQVFCFLAMHISIRRSRWKSRALSLEEAHKLVRPKKWILVNFQLIGFLILLITSNLLNFCCSSKGGCNSCDAVGAMFNAIWSIVLWLTVISCLVYATLINGAIAQAKQGNQQIIEMDGGTVKEAIEIHQRICKIGMQTVKVYHTWFLLNSACYFWLIGYIAIVFLTQSTHMNSWFVFYHLSVCGLYCLFAFLHPWLSAGSLTRAYSKLTRKLNTNLEWKPNHPFCDRSKLDSFLLYASNSQCQFSQITCSSSLPYISLFLALCGLGLKFFQ